MLQRLDILGLKKRVDVSGRSLLCDFYGLGFVVWLFLVLSEADKRNPLFLIALISSGPLIIVS